VGHGEMKSMNNCSTISLPGQLARDARFPLQFYSSTAARSNTSFRKEVRGWVRVDDDSL